MVALPPIREVLKDLDKVPPCGTLIILDSDFEEFSFADLENFAASEI